MGDQLGPFQPGTALCEGLLRSLLHRDVGNECHRYRAIRKGYHGDRDRIGEAAPVFPDPERFIMEIGGFATIPCTDVSPHYFLEFRGDEIEQGLSLDFGKRFVAGQLAEGRIGIDQPAFAGQQDWYRRRVDQVPEAFLAPAQLLFLPGGLVNLLALADALALRKAEKKA